ncbi:uncharacterized protein LOC119670445 isoform X2 [Teleopsis dalmanni]|uniref:uncharacterized protein LOC119670445 isoform X2 n=1 Tax=Teleopsis dalmanni TaxID=139649 RepID=UPI0018CFA6EA|nr:uncharacterized protein LOC119670445 isoform X2 [Teleopsis dalmanni]
MALIFLKVFLYVIIPSLVVSDCSVRTENGVILLKDFGFKKIYIKDVSEVTAKHNESIQFFCNGQIDITDTCRRSDITKLVYTAKLFCNLNTFQLIQNETITLESYCDFRISCSKINGLKLYESGQKLPNCDKYMSIGIGVSISEFKEVSGAICYDWANLSLKYVSYLTSNSDNNLNIFDKYQRTETLHTVTLDKLVDNYELYFNFMSTQSFEAQLNDIKLRNSILDGVEFDYLNIADASKFSAHDNILNIVWWKNLRYGNWRRYLEILKQRAKSVQYLVYLGTAGIITIPNENYIQNQTLLNAPEYIWSYLISTNPNQTSEELVIVGYNSPFAKLNAENSPIFCQDICDEVSWLNLTTFRDLRLIASQGVTFCCRPEANRQISSTTTHMPMYTYIEDSDLNNVLE